jgi:hypothetical protein
MGIPKTPSSGIALITIVTRRRLWKGPTSIRPAKRNSKNLFARPLARVNVVSCAACGRKRAVAIIFSYSVVTSGFCRARQIWSCIFVNSLPICNLARIAINSQSNVYYISAAVRKGDHRVVRTVWITGWCDIGCTRIATPAGCKRAAPGQTPVIRRASTRC